MSETERDAIETLREALAFPQAWLYPNAPPELKAERERAYAALSTLEREARLKQVALDWANNEADRLRTALSTAQQQVAEANHREIAEREAKIMAERDAATAQARERELEAESQENYDLYCRAQAWGNEQTALAEQLDRENRELREANERLQNERDMAIAAAVRRGPATEEANRELREALERIRSELRSGNYGFNERIVQLQNVIDAALSNTEDVPTDELRPVRPGPHIKSMPGATGLSDSNTEDVKE